MADVDSIRIESDERGFEMHLTVCEEPTVDEQGRMILNIHAVATDLVREVKKIAEWEAEGLAAAAEYAVAIREDGSLRMEPDEDAYDPTDPKHPDWHSVHADIWDARAPGLRLATTSKEG